MSLHKFQVTIKLSTDIIYEVLINYYQHDSFVAYSRPIYFLL